MVNQAAFGQWNSVQDSGNDSVNGNVVGGTKYEIYSIAYREVGDQIVFAISTNLNPNGVNSQTADDGRIAFGDLILNFNPNSTINQANGNLYGIRFIGDNESGVRQTGVFQNVSVNSIAEQNGLESGNLQGYVNYINNNGGNHSFGDNLAPGYFAPNEHIKNVIARGDRVGGVEFLTGNHALLRDARSIPGFAAGQFVYGFSIDRSSLPSGNFTAHLAPECGNDIIAINGRLSSNPDIDIEKWTQGIDADYLEDAVGVRAGDIVEWTYRVTNTGDIAFREQDIEVTDDQGLVPVLDRRSDRGNDGILDPGEVWLYRASEAAQDQRIVIDFDTDANGNPLGAGTIIDDEYRGYGLTIESLTYPDRGDPTSTILTNRAMIFDSANPTGDDEPDLSTPHINFGGSGTGAGGAQGQPGENNTALNNILILPEPKGTSEDPNDSRFGGEFTFKWDEPVYVNDIGFLDIEDAARDPNGATYIETFDADGNLLHRYVVPGLGDNSFQTIQLNGELASEMKVVFGGSGAITGLSFDQHYKNIGAVKIKPGINIRDEDPSHYTAARPSIDIEKHTNGVDADTVEDAAVIRAGDRVTWEYIVTNTGNTPFRFDDVVVTDDDENLTLRFDRRSDVGGDRLLSPGEVWTYRAVGRAEQVSVDIDFDRDSQGNLLPAGTVIDTEYQDLGLTISALTRDGRPHPHGTMIFDTENPTGDDIDLGTPNSSVGGPGIGNGGQAGTPGANLVPLSNVLILSGDGDSSDPDDAASGGTFVFEWDNPVDFKSIGIMDIEEPGSRIITYDADGNELGTYEIPPLGDNSVQTVDLNAQNISSMKVFFRGSGAITDLKYERPYKNVGSVMVKGWEAENVHDFDLSHYVTGIPASNPSPLVPISLFGTSGDDILQGRRSADYLAGFGGDDQLNGRQGNDHVHGGNGHDHLLGGHGNDALIGGHGNDVIAGGQDHDRLRGNTGKDILRGNAGSDLLFGDRGSDRLYGGPGRDRLMGGAGKDMFMIRRSDGIDIIGDFSQRQGDRIGLLGSLSFDDLTLRQRGADAIVKEGRHVLCVLQNTDISTLQSSNFVSV